TAQPSVAYNQRSPDPYYYPLPSIPVVVAPSLAATYPAYRCPRLPLPTTTADHHRSSLSLPRYRLSPLSLLAADISSKKGQPSLILSH
ncbi:hypothetical protein B296_00053408, partial [Ensete ventricosum]